MHYDNGFISKENKALADYVLDVYNQELKNADITFNLLVSDETIKERVEKRNRGSETKIDFSFFMSMNKAYSNSKVTFSKFIL